jgi:hypothetical protein
MRHHTVSQFPDRPFPAAVDYISSWREKAWFPYIAATRRRKPGYHNPRRRQQSRSRSPPESIGCLVRCVDNLGELRKLGSGLD